MICEKCDEEYKAAYFEKCPMCGAFPSSPCSTSSTTNQQTMKPLIHSITELENSLTVCENNEPINRARGDIAQADLEKKSADDFRRAIEILKESAGQTEFPDCSGDPSSCPENEGYGCCKSNDQEEPR